MGLRLGLGLRWSRGQIIWVRSQESFDSVITAIKLPTVPPNAHPTAAVHTVAGPPPELPGPIVLPTVPFVPTIHTAEEALPIPNVVIHPAPPDVPPFRRPGGSGRGRRGL